jgi:hypothetical protein
MNNTGAAWCDVPVLYSTAVCAQGCVHAAVELCGHYLTCRLLVRKVHVNDIFGLAGFERQPPLTTGAGWCNVQMRLHYM